MTSLQPLFPSGQGTEERRMKQLQVTRLENSREGLEIFQDLTLHYW